jgi:hypothetical protein
MNIEAKDFEMKMTYGELWATAFDVQYALEHTIKTHWINHQQNWKQNEADRLSRLRNMFYALGRPELHESIFAKAESIFKDFNSKSVAG